MKPDIIHIAALEAKDARIKELEDALAYYANPETYHGCMFMFDHPTGGFDDDFSHDHGHEDYDRAMPGALARNVLKGDHS